MSQKESEPAVNFVSEYIIKLTIMAFIAFVVLFALSLVELYTQLARYKAYWNQSNATAQTIDTDITYVAFGDSAAQGVGATRADNGYVGRVADYLRASNPDSTVRVINLSKSGAKVDDVLTTQLPAYQDLNLKGNTVLTVEIGANDMLTFDAQKFEQEMDQMMQGLPEQTIISDIPFFGKTRFGKLQPNVEVANEIMYRLADKHDFKLANLHDRVQANGGLLTMASDVFHPSNKGYRENWAPAFIDRLKAGQ